MNFFFAEFHFIKLLHIADTVNKVFKANGVSVYTLKCFKNFFLTAFTFRDVFKKNIGITLIKYFNICYFKISCCKCTCFIEYYFIYSR